MSQELRKVFAYKAGVSIPEIGDGPDIYNRAVCVVASNAYQICKDNVSDNIAPFIRRQLAAANRLETTRLKFPTQNYYRLALNVFESFMNGHVCMSTLQQLEKEAAKHEPRAIQWRGQITDAPLERAVSDIFFPARLAEFVRSNIGNDGRPTVTEELIQNLKSIVLKGIRDTQPLASIDGPKLTVVAN